MQLPGHGERGICNGKFHRRLVWPGLVILRQLVIRNAALGRLANRIDGIVATGRAMGNFPKIWLEIVHGRRVCGLFAFFQRPFLFGGVNLPEVVDAGIGLRDGPGFDEIGNGDGGQYSGHGDGWKQSNGGGALVAVADGQTAIFRVDADGIGKYRPVLTEE